MSHSGPCNGDSPGRQAPCLASPFAIPEQLWEPLLQMRDLSHCPKPQWWVWKWPPSPAQGSRLPRPLPSRPVPHPHSCLRPSTSAHQLVTASRTTPMPGLATSQPEMSRLGARAPEPIFPFQSSWPPPLAHFAVLSTQLHPTCFWAPGPWRKASFLS